jgi:hypothetical protein
VLCEPKDPYYILALQISQSESIPLYHTLDRALAPEPRFLLWVGSPAGFSDKVLVRFGLALKARRCTTCFGIISGATLADARALWQRASRVRAERVYAVNGEYPAAQIERGRILTSTGMIHASAPLTKASLTEVLKNADYLTFTGHGGGSYWRLAEGVRITAEDIPPLPPAVISTAGCQGVRLGSGSSIALAAVAQGAAAYAGFLFSPNEGYLFGEFDGLPFRYTWPRLTIGDVMRMQNRGAMEGFAAFPFYLLLGDPRISMQPEPALSLLRIETARRMRSLSYGEAPAGVFPFRIRDGARYHFVEIPGVTAASDHDLFYNARLQMVDEGADKLALVAHPGGDLTINLRPDAPWYWMVTDPLTDSLDHTFLLLPRRDESLLYLGAAGLALLGVIYMVRRKRAPLRVLLPGLLAGLAMGLSYLLYASYRLASVSVSSKPAAFGSSAIVATALLASCGVIFYIGAGSLPRKLLGVTVAVFPSLAPSIFSFSAILVFNTFFARPALGTGIYNYSLTWMSLIGLSCHAAVFMALAFLLDRAWKRSRL